MAASLSVCLGLGVAAACGFRIFLPFLVMNLAARAGYLTLAGDLEWIGGTPALITFAVATVLEIAAYYIPGIDNLLDAVATPAAVVAGILASAAVVTGMDPYLKWTLATIAGGSVAGAVQITTVGVRQASLLATGGLANPVVSSVEAAASLVMTIVSLLLPVLAVALMLLVLLLARRRLRTRRQRMQRGLAR